MNAGKNIIQGRGFNYQDTGYKMSARVEGPASSILYPASCIYVSFILYLASSLLHPVSAQVYPVQGNAALIPPYSVHLTDYTSRANDRLILNIILNNDTRPELPVRLRLKIEGQNIKIETKQEYIGSSIMLQGGIPLHLSGADLIEYFNPANLTFSGITQREFEKTGALPQGFYQFCFEVLEYNRGVKISNTICAPGWLILNDPPIVNIPRNNEKIKPTLPQNVIFQWTPRHTGSPNSAFSTEYELAMVEVWPANRNPNDAILTSPPILETTTRSTSFVYGPAETPLEPGRRYAFRVKAKSIVGVEEYDLFKNNGFSEVFSFVYGDACGLPSDIKVNAIGSSRFNVTWQGQFNHTAFNVRYREAGTTDWYENASLINESEVTSLKPVTTYEYQVSGDCGFLEGQYSSIAQVKTKEIPETLYSCGLPLETFTLDPSQLATSLNVGDIIQAGDFAVKLSKVSGSNGLFSGEAVVEVPYFNKAKVKIEFSNITVNKELRMINGTLNVTGAGVDAIPGEVLDFMDKLTETVDVLEGVLDSIENNLPEHFDPHSFVADTLISVTGSINAVYRATDGSVVIIDTKGNEQRLPPGTTVAVKDDTGKGYLVDSKGKVHNTTAAIAAKAGNREYNLQLNFSANTLALNGFDEKKYDVFAKDYEKLEGGYWVPWKAVEAGKTDKVTALLQNSSIDKSKIHFEMGGEQVSAPPIGNSQTATIDIPGKFNDTVEDLIALYTPSDTGKQQVIGKLKVASYSLINKDVVIVLVNGATFPGSIQSIKTRLDEIYHQAVVNWNVTVAQPGVQVTFDNEFDDGETGIFTNYTADMKKVINAYESSTTEDKFYLFIVNVPTKSGANALGRMPRGKQAGFIFGANHGSDASHFATTIAHELGHGAFNLQHTFDEFPTLTKGSTDNLMDYPAGLKLNKYQWSKIRHSDIVIGLFEEDEDAALNSNKVAFKPYNDLANLHPVNDNFLNVFQLVEGSSFETYKSDPRIELKDEVSGPSMKGTFLLLLPKSIDKAKVQLTGDKITITSATDLPEEEQSKYAGCKKTFNCKVAKIESTVNQAGLNVVADGKVISNAFIISSDQRKKIIVTVNKTGFGPAKGSLKVHYAIPALGTTDIITNDPLGLKGLFLKIFDKDNKPVFETYPSMKPPLLGGSYEWDGVKINKARVSVNDFPITVEVDYKGYRDSKKVEFDVVEYEWDQFQKANVMQQATLERYKVRRQLYIDRLKQLGVDPGKTSPIDYLNENIVAGDFLGRPLPAVNIRYLYVLRKVEEALGRGKNWSENTAGFNQLVAVTPVVQDYARMSSVTSSSGSYVSDHGMGFAFDFFKISNIWIDNSENPYIIRFIDIVTGKRLAGYTYTAEESKEYQNLFVNRTKKHNTTKENLRQKYAKMHTLETEKKLDELKKDQIYETVKDKIINIKSQLTTSRTTDPVNFEQIKEKLVTNLKTIFDGFEDLSTVYETIGDVADAANDALFIEYVCHDDYQKLEQYLAESESKIEKIEQIYNHVIACTSTVENWNKQLDNWINELDKVINTNYSQNLLKVHSAILTKKEKLQDTFQAFGLKLNTEFTRQAEEYYGQRILDRVGGSAIGFFSLPVEVVNAIKNQEITINNRKVKVAWGGAYSGTKDYMHFELKGSGRADQIAVHELDISAIKEYLNSFAKSDGQSYNY